MLRLITLSVLLAAAAGQNGYDYNRPGRPFTGTTPGRPGTTPGRPGSTPGRPGSTGAFPQGTATSPSGPEDYNQGLSPTGYPSGPNQGYLTPNRPSYPGAQGSGAQVTGPDGQTGPQGQGNFPGASTGAGYPGQGSTGSGYPEQGSTGAGYPGQGSAAASYPGQQGTTSAGYPGQQGTTGAAYPGQQSTTGAAYPGQQGSSGTGYTGQQGATGSGYPGQQGSTGSGYPGQQGATGAFPGQGAGLAGFPQGSNAGLPQGGGFQAGAFGQQSQTYPEDSGAYEGGDYSAIPGEPERDYPVLAAVPETSFRCDAQQYPGYYADVETRCQAFHVCANNRTYDFLCPNGTIFSQQVFVCVWWNQFDCATAPGLFELNANLYDYSQTGQNRNNQNQNNQNNQAGDFTQVPQYQQGLGNAPSTNYPGYTGSQQTTGFAGTAPGAGPEYPGTQTGFPSTGFTGSTPGLAGSAPTPAYPQEGAGGRPSATGYPVGRPAGPGLPARPGSGFPQQPTREYLPPRI